MFNQVQAPPAHVKERAYPKTITQGGDAERYGEIKFRIDETIFAAYDKAELRKAMILMIESSEFVHTLSLCFDRAKIYTSSTLLVVDTFENYLA